MLVSFTLWLREEELLFAFHLISTLHHIFISFPSIYTNLIIYQNARLTPPHQLIKLNSIKKQNHTRKPLRQQLLVSLRSHRIRSRIWIILAIPLHGVWIRVGVRFDIFSHFATIRPSHSLLRNRIRSNTSGKHALHIRPY